MNEGDDYSGFFVTVASGYLLDISSLTFDTVGDEGPDRLAVLTSVNGFTTADAEGDFAFTSSSTAQTVTGVQGAEFNALGAGTYEFRFYTYEGNETFEWNNPSRIDNVILSGEVSLIPEPTSLVLALACLGLMRCRRKAV